MFITTRSVCFLLICGRTTRYTSPLTRCLSSESPPLKKRSLSLTYACVVGPNCLTVAVWGRASITRDMIIFIVKLFFFNFTFSPSCLTNISRQSLPAFPHHLFLSPSVLLHALNAHWCACTNQTQKFTPFVSHVNQVDTIKTHDLFALCIFNLISVLLWM